MDGMKRQERDYQIITAIWHILRDYGNIQIGEDPRWQEIVDRADEAARKFPEARKLITEACIGMLEDRTREAYQNAG